MRTTAAPRGRHHRRGPGRLAAAGLTAILVGMVAVLGAAPAWAATGQISQITPASGGHVSVLFGGVGLAPGQVIDPATVTVRIDGQPVTAKAVPYDKSSDATQVRRAAALTIDTSGSMSRPSGTPGKTRLEAAKDAANAYLAAVPADVEVGLVTIAPDPTVVVAPTTNRAGLRAMIAGLQPRGDTQLYDGVVLATTTLGTEGSRSIVLLSDGNDSGSTTTPAQAAAAVKKSGVTVDAVSLQAAASPSLTALAAAGGGTVVPAGSSAELTRVFQSAAQSFASQVVVDVTVPPTVAGATKPLEVSATAGQQTIGDQVVVLLPTADQTNDSSAYGPQPVTATSSITSEPWFLPVAIGAVGVGLAILLGVALAGREDDNSRSGRIGRRLSRYSLTSRKPSAPPVESSGALGSNPVARSAVDLASRVTQRADLDTTLATRLDAAGVPLRPAEWVLLHVGLPILLALVFLLISGFSVLAGVLGIVIGVLAPFAYLSLKESKRKAAFSDQLPDTLQLLSGSLSAGYSLPQATDVVVRESSPPMSVELNRALVEARLGVPLEDALDTTARRMDNIDLSWVVMAVRIQREVGGNLAEVLSSVAATMRERERLRRQVRVLSAEGRLSAAILLGLPLLFIVYLVVVRPEYISQLVTEPLGVVMSVVGVVLLVAGAFWLRKTVDVEV